MKLVSWNVNGLRACVKKGFLEYFYDIDADIFCIQETKLKEGQIDVDLPGYLQYWNYAEKKGYSGTAVFTKYKPLTVSYGFSPEESEREGRIITLEYENFYLVNVYTPNSQRDLARLKFRLEWEDKLKKYLLALNEKKPVVYCGDLNVAHQEIDLKNAKSNIGNSGFTNEEREKMTSLLASGFIDTFRYLHPDAVDRYTWWSYMNKVRDRNIGWRIDYFIVSESIKEKIVNADIHSHVLGSDHCPILLEIDL
ncbi:Exodeoxyribonuclease III [Caldibacillus thermoamylovorans]|uniref:Exodeoxyribonuclease n=1 Tax=Caldibacillus thermoamylovorans TaxID=35841 RepID=A0A090IUI5_9BACI|nr:MULTISPECIES: exodeoxyribonuclease III [Bacillaceae]KIO68818.1 Exodeoxyribonuclease III [Caldibacillus thermoamylovorans]KIO69659.1 Exodeoxyribonuclease III [Caldibacillus thermoamylovorans]KIO72892.1 Exodeoxyribonuclease III [Caldibacillus thermoamylovorans]MED3644960.1 exodeoxyribonuclease III [Caldifermentibacillus hisashii]CEE01741.1 Exodeoxyribonuclease [Caldibacillus thermoamylovorans]